MKKRNRRYKFINLTSSGGGDYDMTTGGAFPSWIFKDAVLDANFRRADEVGFYSDLLPLNNIFTTDRGGACYAINIDDTVNFSASNSLKLSSFGLTVENDTENVFPESNNFSNGDWVVSGLTAVNNSVGLAPDGGSATELDVSLRSGGAIAILNDVTIAGIAENDVYVFSVWLSAQGLNIGKNARLQLKRSTGGFSATQMDVVLMDTPQRVELVYTVGSLPVGLTALFLKSTIDPAEEYIIWGAQLEKRSVATSYKPTSGAALNLPFDDITRDVNEIFGASSTEGSIRLEFNAPAEDGEFVYQVVASGSGHNLALYQSPTTLKFRVIIPSQPTAYFTVGDFEGGEEVIICAGWKESDLFVSVNGSESVTHTISAAAFDFSGGEFTLGSAGSSASAVNQRFKRMVTFNDATAELTKERSAIFTGGYDVILLAGQSNMVGKGNPIDPVLDATDPNVYQYGNNRDIVVVGRDALDHVDEAIGDMGLGMTFAKRYASETLLHGRTVLLVPVADGGTGFNTGYWRSGGVGYINAVNQANAAMIQGNGENRFVGMLWHQGESDSFALNQAQYSADIDLLISGFRSEITGASATTPFVVGEMLETWERPQSDPIRAALLDTPNRNDYTSHVASFDLNDSDGIHFDAPSFRILGDRYFLAFDAAKDNALPTPEIVEGLNTVPATTSVMLSWDTPVSTKIIVDYHIQYKQTSSGTWLMFVDAVSPITTVSVTGLLSSTSYDFRVSCEDESGEGDYSLSVSELTL